MSTRILVAALVSPLLLTAGAAGAVGKPGPVPTARAAAIQVIIPGQVGPSAGVVPAPPAGTVSGAGFVYPDDGSAVSIGAFTAKASAADASATASADLSSISLFGGELTVDAVSVAATATVTAEAGSGSFPAAVVTNLVALGTAVAVVPGARVPLGDWGYVDVLGQSAAPGIASGAPNYRGSIMALAVRLTADHGGLPSGTEILIGFAEASARWVIPAPEAPPAPPTTTAPLRQVPKPKPTPAAPTKPARAADIRPDKPAAKRKVPLKPPEPLEATPGGNGLPVLHTPPLSKTPKLTAGRYVFPVYGPSSYTNTFGAPRANVVWHHGDDIFAPLGAPILAVADGTVFSVGWNHIGGYRLWLRDRQGNQFYYAHLSAYSPLAVNGAKVTAGTVLGFVGSTGDAVGTPYHLHFEIHPVSLLHLGYDGAVDPTPYLDAWKRLEDVRFAPAGWAAPPGKPKPGVKPAPPPGAILLRATDISTASGLDPGSFERVLAPVATEGDGALIGLEQQPPDGPRPVRTLPRG